jgi:hypothetical protein
MTTAARAAQPAPPAQAPPGGTGASSPGIGPASLRQPLPVPPAAGLWRKWRVPAVLVALILLGGTVIALLQPPVVITGYLDPAGTGSTGAHALADLLSGRGDTVIRAITPAAAEAAARSPGRGTVTLVVTSPGLLTASELHGLAQVPANRVLIGPDQAALAALAPRVRLLAVAPVQPLSPSCGLAAARLAGTADMGGAQLAVRPAAQAGSRGARPAAGARAAQCYPVGGAASLVRFATAGRVVTVLGAGNALTNGSLARLGNASLALNLLGTHARIVWLVPSPALQATGLPGSGQKSLLSLIPLPAYLVALQLGIAALLAALWRMRRLGPLVPEPLPVVVRASETVEGHAALYRSRRARGRAAAALRTAMLARALPALGLAPGAPDADVVAALSARSGSAPAQIEAMLFAPPRDDRALVALADRLDALEKEVRTQ